MYYDKQMKRSVKNSHNKVVEDIKADENLDSQKMVKMDLMYKDILERDGFAL